MKIIVRKDNLYIGGKPVNFHDGNIIGMKFDGGVLVIDYQLVDDKIQGIRELGIEYGYQSYDPDDAHKGYVLKLRGDLGKVFPTGAIRRENQAPTIDNSTFRAYKKVFIHRLTFNTRSLKTAKPKPVVFEASQFVVLYDRLIA